MLLGTTIGFIKIPKAVSIDNFPRSITLRYIFGKDLTLTAEQIESFSTGYLYLRTAPNRYKLIQLILTDGKVQILTEFDLSDIDPVRQFLEKNRVLNLGETRFNYFKYALGY